MTSSWRELIRPAIHRTREPHSLGAHRGAMVALPVIDLDCHEQRSRLGTHGISSRRTFGA